jgi:hypothetical protein
VKDIFSSDQRSCGKACCSPVREWCPAGRYVEENIGSESCCSTLTAQNLFPDGNAKAFDYIESIEFIDLLFAGESAIAKCVLFYIKVFCC